MLRNLKRKLAEIIIKVSMGTWCEQVVFVGVQLLRN